MLINKSFQSLNFNERNNSDVIKILVIHDTRMFSHESVIERLCSPVNKVSCHYVIAKSGEIFNLVDESKLAWHAGSSFWRGDVSLNNYSIGIELDNKGDEAFTDAQYKSLIVLAQDIIKRHEIKPINIVGHSDISPWRKVDPNAKFVWQTLYDNGIGLYSKAIVGTNEIVAKYGDENDGIVKIKENLNSFGYRILNFDNRFDHELLQVIYTFKKHFVPATSHNIFWDELSNIRLNDLLKQIK